MASRYGQFLWHEHVTKDTEAAIAFYTEVLGWETRAFAGGYIMWITSQGWIGGVMELPAEAAEMGVPPHWMGYVHVADVDATAARAKELGGKVWKEPFDTPTVGRFAILADPQGATLTVVKPVSVMPAHDVSKEGEFCWNELLSTDAARSWAFFSELFGWTTLTEMDMGAMGTYRIYGVGEQRLGGMMNAPAGMPSAWVHYVEVADLDSAIARATKCGAKVMNGPIEVPGGAHVAQLTDPQGAVFALHQAVPAKA